ncbi:MAG: HlyD family efflux transporter periplasmic adaptor subunit [Magnetococcales bacterium]|nr:efflux RND transporter periplasmic adaptor subunit [Magnetococcales bacterium]NGZ27122.1 HlyD family efflux transporter periplasmic adaptor subunit [Magnetococcales bacterium]
MRFAQMALIFLMLLMISMAEAGQGNSGEGDRYEVVITPQGEGSSRLYLSDITTNAPIGEANIQVEVASTPPWSGSATPTGTKGIYRLLWSPSSPEGVDLTLTILAKDGDDLVLLAMSGLEIPQKSAPSQANTPDYSLILLGGIVLVAAFLLLSSRRKKSVQTVAVLLVLVSMGEGEVFAHGGEDHGTPDGEESSLSAGRKVPLSKESQYLLEVRTVVADSNQVAENVRLVGKVIPDPAAHARIHPSIPARVGFDRDFPPPTSGQWVKQGQTLAVLDPIMSAADKAGQRLTLFRGERTDSMPVRELVLAPIPGQLTDVHVVPGEVVSEGTVLAEIIDPNRLWVEAVLFDLLLADRIVAATASSRQFPGRSYALSLVGISPTVNPENQGLHVQFKVQGAVAPLKAGMPLDVYAQTGTTQYGVAVPRVAVLDHGGIPRVWVKVAAEQFEARQVQTGRRTGEWVEILAGLRKGEKVVVQGHNQINAIR